MRPAAFSKSPGSINRGVVSTLLIRDSSCAGSAKSAEHFRSRRFDFAGRFAIRNGTTLLSSPYVNSVSEKLTWPSVLRGS
jgi:hypothetical protein